MAAFIPNRRDPEVTEAALARVREDKAREAGDGFDGTWVAHPDLVETATSEFDAVLDDRPNQIDRQRPDVSVSPDQLLAVPDTPGEVTEAGIRQSVSVGIRYLAAWLNGSAPGRTRAAAGATARSHAPSSGNGSTTPLDHARLAIAREEIDSLPEQPRIDQAAEARTGRALPTSSSSSSPSPPTSCCRRTYTGLRFEDGHLARGRLPARDAGVRGSVRSPTTFRTILDAGRVAGSGATSSRGGSLSSRTPDARALGSPTLSSRRRTSRVPSSWSRSSGGAASTRAALQNMLLVA
jgi:hypothetical protein